MKKTLWIGGSILALAACAASPDYEKSSIVLPNTLNLKKNWILEKAYFAHHAPDGVSDAVSILPVNVSHTVNLDLSDLPNGHAYVGCNNIGFQVTQGMGHAITFSHMFSTRMLCENMDIEYAFTEQLLNMKQYHFENGKLILSGEQGATMEFMPQK
ncbi:MAG: META domain-containing protein [Alysiella sp.]|uniref:META domain-containing protein n=1 Tax=Alysiella sp. TaxID=1872483 RepID=UPI0026DDBFA5|nr:META domain-containing protein [Alysiella sp.]MDO4433293.1 META domain-containing protein [Alysiella sp.]